VVTRNAYHHIMIQAVDDDVCVSGEGYIPTPLSMESFQYWTEAIVSEMIARLAVIPSVNLDKLAVTMESWPIVLSPAQRAMVDKVIYSFRVSDTNLFDWGVEIRKDGKTDGQTPR